MFLMMLTLLHVAASLLGLVAGFSVLFGLIVSRQVDQWMARFLWATLVTTLTGFLFPVHQLLPSHVVGLIEVVVLSLAFLARQKLDLSGRWRRQFVIAVTVALYFNTFVAIIQCFKHIPWLQTLAPTQSEPPFLVTQSIVLLLFIALGITATRRFSAIP